MPGSVCASKSPLALDPETRLLAAIAYGEASVLDDPEEIGGIAFAVANRARAWGHKSVEQLLAADPNYTYAVKDGNQRYARLMAAKEADIEADASLAGAVRAAQRALAGVGPDPSHGAFWWDGIDFKTNHAHHPKVADGFRFGDPAHNIFGVAETSNQVATHWLVKDKAGQLVEGKERGHYDHVWVSTAARGRTIFWKHDPDYLRAEGVRPYR